jgi:hypothetical protein
MGPVYEGQSHMPRPHRHLHINTFEKELGLEVLCCVRKLQDPWETWDGEHDFIEEEYFELLEELVRHESK